jgi:hypothetical protein
MIGGEHIFGNISWNYIKLCRKYNSSRRELLSMSNCDIEKFKFYLMEELVVTYNMTELEAQRAIVKSTVNKMLKQSPEFIMHYSIEDNAKEIYDEYNGIPMEM